MRLHGHFGREHRCAEDHVVIETLRELDADTWDTVACCFRYRILNHWTEGGDQMWRTQLVTMVKKKTWKIYNERIPTDCDAANCLPYIYHDAAGIGGRHTAVKEWSSVWTRPRSSSS